jgi:hypothetical protein
MKKSVLFAGIISAALLTGLVLSGCGTRNGNAGDADDGQKTGSNDILNETRWEETSGDVPPGGLRLTFISPDFTMTGIADGTVYFSGTYTVARDVFTPVARDDFTGKRADGGTFNGAVSGNTLTYTSTSHEGVQYGTMLKK